MEIRKSELRDSAALAEIYNFYIENSHATFETRLIDSDEMNRRQRELSDSGFPFLIAENDGIVAGYAFGHRYRPRDAYRHSVETSIYICTGFEGQGIGTALYEVLIPALTSMGFHALIAGISLPNASRKVRISKQAQRCFYSVRDPVICLGPAKGLELLDLMITNPFTRNSPFI